MFGRLYPDKTCKEENFLFVNKQGIKNNLEQLASEIYNCTFGRVDLLCKRFRGDDVWFTDLSDFKKQK